MNRRLILPGGILWIAGLAMSIIGMNIHTDSGSLIAVIGNILFLVGLGIVGAAWLMERKNSERKNSEQKNPEGKDPEQKSPDQEGAGQGK